MNNETYFLGQCMWQPSIVYESKLVPNDFRDPTNRKIFDAMLELTREGTSIDEGHLHERTGVSLVDLMALKDNNIVPANWGFFEQQIKETNLQLRIKEKFSTLIESKGKNSTDLIAEAQIFLDSLQNSIQTFGITSIKDTVNSSLALIAERALQSNKHLIGLSSGVRKLDEFTAGFQPRKLYVIGARPSQGKTALLINCIRNCKVPCGVLSAESAKEELMIRLYAGSSNIDSQKIAVGLLSVDEIKSLNRVAEEFCSENNINFYDEPNMDIHTAEIVARQMVRGHGIKILFVDYLQCLNFSGAKEKSEHREKIAYISKLMKQLARTLNIPVVVAAQLRRDAEGTRPQLSDFSDSTQIERDADVAIMIYNTNNNGEPDKSWLLVEKNRDGRTGDIPVVFNRATVTFTDKPYP